MAQFDNRAYGSFFDIDAPPVDEAGGRGLTIASFVQQVLYAIYKVRLDTTFDPDLPGTAFHADTDKFKEVLMEANFVLQEIQKEQDWNFLRERWSIGTAEVNDDGSIMEFELPSYIYKVCTGFNDAVRLHDPNDPNVFIEVPFTSPRNGQTQVVSMFDNTARLNVPDTRLMAFIVGNTLTFSRPFSTYESGALIETDVIRFLDPLHICHAGCVQPCPSAYDVKVLTEIPDPYYMIVRTAAKRAEGDPSATDRVLSLGDEAMKLLSAMRENDSSKTVPDTYQTAELGYTRIL